MGRLFQGSEGFRYVYRSVRKDIPLGELARISRVGTLRLEIDHYDVRMPPDENRWVYPGELEELLDIEEDEDRGFYEADNHDVTAKELFDQLVQTEIERHIEALMDHFGENVESVSILAAVQYRLLEDEWEDMLNYLNGLLPAELQLNMDELRTFDSECLGEYDPELHEAHRDDGTLFLQTFLDKDPEGLAYLAFRILVHAIQHEVEVCDIDDEPRWRTTISAADENEDEEGEDDE